MLAGTGPKRSTTITAWFHVLLLRHWGQSKEEQERLLEDYESKFNTPFQASKYGYIDDVILPRHTRARVINELRLLRDKQVPQPVRKHGNSPL